MAIRSAAVLGAGTMGAAIAAHFTNAGIPATLLDLVPPDLKRIHPSAFFTSSGAALITPGSFDDNLASIASADIIVEAVTENLDIKRALWSRALQHAKPTAVLATNTSGIPLRSICEGWPDGARRRFVGMHFFNPPRYLYLLELIPGPATDPALLASLQHFGEQALGKGVVLCKDTPNFIGNRIGAFFGSTVYKLMRELDLTIEEVDALTGPVIGLPKSASFRLLDLVGLDVWKHVSQNLHDLAPTDPWRERFLPPDFLSEIIARGWLGDKTGQGFYRRNKDKSIDCIDWKTLEYHPAAKPKLPAVENAKLIEDLPTRLRTLCDDTGKTGQFLRTLFTETWHYAAERLPEIAHSEADIDHAMQWGYAHTFGPFQIAEILGLRPAASAVSSQTPTVHTNAGASLKDLGDGCLLLEFHSKMNSLGPDGLTMVHKGIAELDSNFDAMVIGNHGENFSAGANLMLVLLAAQEQEWDELDRSINYFQQTFLALKYASKPVVAAPHQRALGGGCEIVLHSYRVQAHAELYMGQVEVGVGVIPAAGGCKELIARLKDPRKVFELTAMAKVSSSADNAKELGLLDKSAGVTMNKFRLIGDAKQAALSLVPSYRPGSPRSDIKVGGDPAFAALHMGAWLMLQAGYISDHDMLIADKLARVITGGPSPGERLVSEQHLLDLEREAFLSLCGTQKTQERIAHMLKTGKPLRN